MKKVDTSIRIAVCGSANFKLDWNREVIRMVGDITDYLSIHHYEDPDKFAEGPRDYERFIRETGKLIAASANPNITALNAAAISLR
jgi:alpha-N-arabinofuranosidase